MPAIPAKSLDAACAEIYQRWCRFIPESEASAEAQAFRERCLALAAEGHLTERELDATLEIVGDVMVSA
jgi:hypothetical protein